MQTTHLICVPIIVGGIEPLSLVGLHQLVVVVHTHRRADDFADVRHQEVDRVGECRVVLTPTHVEGLDVRGKSGSRDASFQNFLQSQPLGCDYLILSISMGMISAKVTFESGDKQPADP